MKNLIIATIITLVSFGSSSAFAVWAPNWERPIHSSEMQVVKSDGVFDGAYDVVLVMNKRDSSKDAATSFSLEFSKELADGSVMDYSYSIPVEQIEYTRCGSTFFKGVAKLFDPDMATGYYPEIAISLERKSPIMTRGCGSLRTLPVVGGGLNSALDNALNVEIPQKSNQWKVTVKFEEKGSVQSFSTLVAAGEAEDVFTIQNSDR